VKVSYASRFLITIERNGGVVVTSGEDVTAVAPTTATETIEQASKLTPTETGTPGLLKSTASEHAIPK